MDAPTYYITVPLPDGEAMEVTRTMRLLYRLEARLGPIDPLAVRLEKGHATQREIVAVIEALLHDVSATFEPPTRSQIEAMVFKGGTHAYGRRLAIELYTLIMGDDTVRSFLDQRRRSQPILSDAPEASAGDGVPGPFVRVAVSTGAGGAASLIAPASASGTSGS